MDACVKQEDNLLPEKKRSREIISISSSSSSYISGFSSDDNTSDVELDPERKRQRPESVLPVGFLDPIQKPLAVEPISVITPAAVKQENDVEKGKEKVVTTVALLRGCKQFWKAGDYEGSCNAAADHLSLADMDRVRVHPRFLHSNATSHKWSLGAFAELLDNALDEELYGATYALVDVLNNIKDGNKMVLVQDDGGGMTPDKMRQCMSLGYSEKSKMANTIGQYGNGFKTSTMRLGADVIVFSRCKGMYNSGRVTQSIGLLSYTFLTSTGKEDIVVPMIDFEKSGESWNKLVRSSSDCWQRNLETIVQWSPFETEEDLFRQFDFLSDQGTRIIIYNLWEDDQGLLELDFDTDPHDIQIRDANRDDKKIEMAKNFPSSRHFLTYRHSLRSYTSILYLRVPPGFRIILRGKDVEHHNIVDDMMHTREIVYKPAACPDVTSKHQDTSAMVTLGFIKDAESHIDVQGFNVYHKNRLIKPFWRVWNAAGSDGRGVIGVLQANFVEPAHDKQGFERTTALSRLENRLIHFQKIYWSSQCQLIGYAQRRNLKKPVSPEKQPSNCAKDKSNSKYDTSKNKNKNVPSNGVSPSNSAKRNLSEATTQATTINSLQPESSAGRAAVDVPVKTEGNRGDESVRFPAMTDDLVHKLKQENHSLRNSLDNVLQDLENEKHKNHSLQNQLINMDQEQEMFVNSFSEERSRRDQEEENLRKRLKDASETIEALLRKVKTLEAKNGLP
ncbi:hypothetical protein CASFOL_000349 [Castilleja foliolosa]|uniref:Morc S5 domain-containing protein n=1 Tax=Castilleja foliolosa TaxID=1961234 RepID=A0ABD3ENP1_9LAMI